MVQAVVPAPEQLASAAALSSTIRETCIPIPPNSAAEFPPRRLMRLVCSLNIGLFCGMRPRLGESLLCGKHLRFGKARATGESEGKDFERATDRVFTRAVGFIRDVGERDRAMRETGVRGRDGAGVGGELGRDQDGGSVRCIAERALGVAKGGV